MRRFLLGIFVLSIFTLSVIKIDACALDANALIPIDQSEYTDFQDLKQSWCKDYVKVCCQAGLLKGKTVDRFDEKSELTNAQITVITARLYEGLTGRDSNLAAENDGPWYSSSYELLKDVMPDVILKEMYLDAPLMPDISNNPCSRTAFAEMLAGVLKAAEVELPKINEVDGIPDTANQNVLMLYQAGVLAGTDKYGFFHGAASLTRGQAAAMLARLVDPSARIAVELEPFDFYEEVLGVSSNATLLHIDGKAVTADEFGGPLCESLLYEFMVNGRTPADAKKAAISDYCENIAAPLLLATDLNISLTQEELDSTLSSASLTAGYMGRSMESWYNESCKKLLAAKVEKQFSNNELPGYDFDMAVKAKCGNLLLEETPTFQALDAKNIYSHYIRFFS